jgi:DNA-binding Lrp family transcriptional regulator
MKKEILKYLNAQGERLDSEIADAIGISVAKTHVLLTELSAAGEIMTCHILRFDKGKKIEGISCRISGHIPKAAPGRKSKVQLKLS